MTTPLHPWHLAFVWAVGWVNRQQNVTIEYLCTENRVLREQVGKKRILVTDDQRRRLAVKDKELGRKGPQPPTSGRPTCFSSASSRRREKSADVASVSARAPDRVR